MIGQYTINIPERCSRFSEFHSESVVNVKVSGHNGRGRGMGKQPKSLPASQFMREGGREGGGGGGG